ncbi:MAG: hypothetical protein KIS66_07370 [Fimbriimonadaceae bacterium]|nr:hypothetical protein [Fimbriimonadaceae bacterium]
MFGALAVCQEGPGPKTSLFSSTNADISLTVRQTDSAAADCEVTAIRRDYDPKVLVAQIQRLGQELGSEIRGLRVDTKEVGTAKPQTFVKAAFGAFGLFDPVTGASGLQAVARAFCGAEGSNAVRALSVTFLGFAPTSKTLRTFSSDKVLVEGRFNENPVFVEYVVALLTQNAEEIVIPKVYEAPAPPEKVAPTSGGLPPLVWVSLVVAAVALGALVYFAMLGSGSRRR